MKLKLSQKSHPKCGYSLSLSGEILGKKVALKFRYWSLFDEAFPFFIIIVAPFLLLSSFWRERGLTNIDLVATLFWIICNGFTTFHEDKRICEVFDRVEQGDKKAEGKLSAMRY